MRRLTLVVIAGLSLLPATPDATAVPSVDRFAGATRYDTAIAVAELLHGSAATAVVAAGTDFPDALAAGVAAAALDAPLLLASDAFVPTDVITNLGVTDVVLIGGTAALSESVASRIALGTGVTVRRVAGVNRYETAAAVTDLAPATSTAIFQVSGETFETALVAAVHAARVGGRLRLVPDVQRDEIVVDGERLVGTSGTLNQALLARFPTSSDRAIVTTISSFPDALSAAALAGALDAPVLFTETMSATQESVDLLRLFDPTALVVVGGSAAVPDAVLQQLFGWLALPPDVKPGASEAMAYDVFARINDERAARGVPSLAWSPALASEARTWSGDMSRAGELAHSFVGPGLGEGVHRTFSHCRDACHLPTSGVLHRDFMYSTSNRETMLEPAYFQAGIGVHCAPDGTVWITQRFDAGGTAYVGGDAPLKPVVHDETSGRTCEGDVVGEQPWWDPIIS